ncbi:MAG: DinB family protein [Armatimonadota bacterium]|nr:DinB family protein [Armatimonadota bacterium]MDR7464394.1 DinB family protein [Armatimonadota bacterium]MDR7470732.1 DinB family protein [Armatimonadota bacterium]MDR7475769.1 DinB family protein [Armatimonadota bacterium]MDR7540406.1 DinB family protein [Armatimonadota bacterium]
MHDPGPHPAQLQRSARGADRPVPATLLDRAEDLDGILAAWRPQREATVALVAGLSPAEARSRRPFPWDPTETASVEEIIWHVVTHEQYHRGQVFTRLALLGRRDLPDHDLLR